MEPDVSAIAVIVAVLASFTTLSQGRDVYNNTTQRIARQATNNNTLSAKPAVCQPELRSVSLRETDDPLVYYMPQCTRLEQCGGCCIDKSLSCQAIESETVNFQVTVMNYAENKMVYQGKQIVSREKHLKCKCDCIVKEKDCNELQEYKQSDCRCVCTNKDAEANCKNDPKKFWNPKNCSCECLSIFECSSSNFYDQLSCSCEPLPTESPLVGRQPEDWEGEYCTLPPPLDNGRHTPSRNRCPSSTSSMACQMVPGTLVPPQWVIFHSCLPGYTQNNRKKLSVCIQGKWRPPLPVCVVDGCYLPVKPTLGLYQGIYRCRPDEVGVAACRNTPGTLVPSSWTIRYTCNPGSVPNSTSAISKCVDSAWENPIDCVKLDGCYLPAQPTQGSYQAFNLCRPEEMGVDVCQNTPGTLVPSFWTIRYTCNPGFSLNTTSEISYCINSDWKNPIHCVKKCKPLTSTSVHITCMKAGRQVPCDLPMEPNTIATPRCKMFYEKNFVPEYISLNCLDNGEWTDRLFDCTPVCGVTQSQLATVSLISNGILAKQLEFPWLATLYKRNESQKFNLICSGTLITHHVVLTAAHCVIMQNVSIPVSDFKVGLGKYYRDFYKNEPMSVIADVREVIVPKNYIGQGHNYALDIALLDLEHSVELTASVIPACFDWSGRPSLIPDPPVNGVVAGWGYTEERKPSDVILATNMTYIPYNECLKSLPPDYVPRKEKFCSIGVNESQLDIGDGGGGFTVIRDNKHFIVGVVSNQFSNTTMITDLEHFVHQSWLNSSIERLNVVHDG